MNAVLSVQTCMGSAECMFINDSKFVGPEVRDMHGAYHLISFYDFICHMVNVGLVRQ